MKRKLKCGESIRDLWMTPEGERSRKAPETESLFRAIAAEAEMCLHKTDWDLRIKKIENFLTIVKGRMRWQKEEMDASEIDRIVKRAKEKKDSALVDRIMERSKEEVITC